MILASLGTMDMPFERMAYAIDQFAASTDEEVVVQTGWTHYEYRHVKRVFRMCTKEEMSCLQKEASLLILQGGWGMIRECMEIGKRMVVVPRYDKTEHIHDQFQLIRKLHAEKAIIGVLPFDGNDSNDLSLMDFSNPKLFESKKKDLFEATAHALQVAVSRAYTYEYKSIEKGSAVELIKKQISILGCGKRICLASSAGGHLRELQLAIGDIPSVYSCYWLTLPTPSTRAFLADKEHVFLHNFQPVKKWTLFANAIPALWWVFVKRPSCIITTGAGVCIPTIGFARKLLGTRVIFINSAADVTHASKTPIWIEKYADLFMVQWKEMLEIFPRAIWCGVL